MLFGTITMGFFSILIIGLFCSSGIFNNPVPFKKDNFLSFLIRSTIKKIKPK